MNINAKQVEGLLQQLSVLVVDDNPFMRNLVRGMLANIGVKKIFEAGDGIAALEMIRSTTPDVVVLDWEMPLSMALNWCASYARPESSRCRTFPSSCSPPTASTGASWNRSSSA